MYGQFEYPLWLQVICWIVIGVFVVFIIRGVYVNCFKSAVAKRRVVKARLISKAEEEYQETTVIRGNTSSPAIKSPASFKNPAKTAYRLYFDVDGKTVELDVTKEIFQQLKEDTVGMLDYKGNYYYDFKV